MEDYLDILKAFVEGEMNLADWQDWWDKNARIIEAKASRASFLRLKHHPFRQARKLLEEFGVPHQPDEGKCQVCGEPLFKAIPGDTSKEDIIQFVHRASLASAEQIEKDGWIHPGEYCPNGCTVRLINYRR